MCRAAGQHNACTALANCHAIPLVHWCRAVDDLLFEEISEQARAHGSTGSGRPLGLPSGPEDMAKSVLWSANVRDAVSVQLHAIVWRLYGACSSAAAACPTKSALTCVASHSAIRTSVENLGYLRSAT
jgi:hypothetical protein